jgi:multiple sugar transport system permease protein
MSRAQAIPAGGSIVGRWLSRWAHSQRALALLFLAPSLAVLCSVVVYPFFSAIWISFQNKYVGAPGQYVGLANYQTLFRDPLFYKVAWNSFVYTGTAVAIKFTLGLAMALILCQERRLNPLFRTILFVPWAVPVIVAALNWRWIYDDFSGMLNNVLLALGLVHDVISWLSDPSLAMWSCVAVVVWCGTPFYTMSFLAALQAIPKEQYEAARIDGASVLHEFWYVTIPNLRNVFMTVVMLSTIFTSTNLVIVYTLTNGGPANKTQIFPNMAYNMALQAGRLGYGSAINLAFFPVLAVLILLLSRQMLRREA